MPPHLFLEIRMKCVLCGNKIFGWGNNPMPLATEGECCGICNDTKVIPARIEMMFRSRNDESRNQTDPS